MAEKDYIVQFSYQALHYANMIVRAKDPGDAVIKLNATWKNRQGLHSSVELDGIEPIQLEEIHDVTER